MGKNKKKQKKAEAPTLPDGSETQTVAPLNGGNEEGTVQYFASFEGDNGTDITQNAVSSKSDNDEDANQNAAYSKIDGDEDANQNAASSNGDNEENTIQNGASFKGDGEEDTRPEVSPYIERSYSLLVGSNGIRYTVPDHYMKKYPHLPSRLAPPTPDSFDWSPVREPDEDIVHTIQVPDLDEDIAHTLVHFLYTGKYQTLRKRDIPISENGPIEYRRSVLVYRAACLYGLPPLVAHARESIEKFSNSVSVFEALDVGRRVYETTLEDETWFSDHLREKFQVAFDADEGVFAQEQFLRFLGDGAALSGILMKIVVDIYRNKVSSLRTKDEQTGANGCNGNSYNGRMVKEDIPAEDKENLNGHFGQSIEVC